MTRIGKILITLGILLVGFGVSALLFLAAEDPERTPVERFVPAVEVLEVRSEDASALIPSQGLVRPLRRTKISSEVGGKVVEMNESFEVGGYVDEGEMFVRIDGADFEAAVARAAAELADAELALAVEQAQAAQARRDWLRLGEEEDASPLMLREPQVANAEARVASAEAALGKARRDHERTVIRAPYAGRILERDVDLGAVLSPGSGIAELVSTGIYEVRLPVSVDDVPLLGMESGDHQPEVVFHARVGGETKQWSGRIVRSAGQVDRSARSVHLIGRVEVEGGDDGPGMDELWMPGFFVQAMIEGRTLEGVFRVPRSALREGNRLLIVDDDDILRFRRVELVHGTRDVVYVSAGLEDGERICLTSLSGVIDGETRVLPTVVEKSAGQVASPGPSLN